MYCTCPIPVTEVEVDDCVATLTVADDAITDLCQGKTYALIIQTCVSNEYSGYSVEVNDGETTKEILTKCGQYWRPDHINARSVIYVRNGNDPDNFIIEGVSKRGCL